LFVETGVVRAVGVFADPESLSGPERLQLAAKASKTARIKARFEVLFMGGFLRYVSKTSFYQQVFDPESG